MKFALGIEIGGTKLQAGIGTVEGDLYKVARTIVDPTKGAVGIRRQLIPLVDEVLKLAFCERARINHIGIGFGGPLNTKRGMTLRSFQIDGWENFPLKQWAEEQWQRPVTIENDASTAGLAEARLGAGRGKQRVFYMTIGSGIGGGWIVDGKIDEGQGLGAAEVGHMYMTSPDSGEAQELELICSGWSIGRRAQTLAAQQSTVMTELAGEISKIDAPIVYTAAMQNDPLALKILDDTCQTLALALNNIIVMLHPERIVIGGGVGQMGPIFWGRLRKAVKKWGFAPFMPTVEIVPATLGADVVVIGALCLGRSGSSL